MPTSPVFVLFYEISERKLVRWLITCYVDTAVMPCKLFHPFFFVLVRGVVLMIISGDTTLRPGCLWQSYGFTLHSVSSLWKGETELGLLTAGNGGGGILNECPSNNNNIIKKKAKKKKARQTQDTWHHQPPPTSVQINVRKTFFLH